MTEFSAIVIGPVASAIALILMIIVTGHHLYGHVDRLATRQARRAHKMVRSVPLLFVILGITALLLLYIPVLVMIALANAGKLSSVWSGFSVKWYGALLENEALLAALAKSLFIAGMATLSTIFHPHRHSRCTLWQVPRSPSTQRPCLSTSCHPRGCDGSLHAPTLHRHGKTHRLAIRQGA